MSHESNQFFDRFQHKGEWWLPETPDKTVHGVLTHDEDETTLDLFGSLRDEDFRTKGEVKIPQPTPVIYGNMESVGPCTLYKNSGQGERMQLFGKTTSSKWRAGVLFVGAHVADPVAFEFTDWTAAYTGLEEWTGYHPFLPSEEKREGDKLVEVSARYVVPPEISIQIDSLGAKLESTFGLRTSGNMYRSQNWEHTFYLILRPDRPKSFDWFFASCRDIQNFLLLCIGEPIYPKCIVAHADLPGWDGEIRSKDIQVYYHYSHRKEHGLRPSADMLMPLRSIAHMLPQMVNHWFAKAEKLRDVYNLFFGTFYNSTLFLESAFLSLTQALETYSRSVRDARYVEPDEYQMIAASLIAAIPPGTPPDLKQSLRSRIKYGNEYSLRKRLTEILGSLEPETVKLICNDPKRFANRIVDTRNYLTHYTNELKADAVRGAELYIANLRLQLLLTILLCKELGIIESSLCEVLKQNPKWLQIIHLHLAKGA